MTTTTSLRRANTLSPAEVQRLAGELDRLQTNEMRLDYGLAVAGEEYFVKIEGAESNIDVRVANLVRRVGNGAMVYGTDQNDTFEFAPGLLYTITINGLDYLYDFHPYSLVTVTFDGGPGHDQALLTGSNRADVATLDLADLRRERIITPLGRDEQLLLTMEELERIKRRRYED